MYKFQQEQNHHENQESIPAAMVSIEREILD